MYNVAKANSTVKTTRMFLFCMIARFSLVQFQVREYKQKSEAFCAKSLAGLGGAHTFVSWERLLIALDFLV